MPTLPLPAPETAPPDLVSPLDATPAFRSRIPARGTAVVRRRRLLDAIDRTSRRGVTLVSAPAGSGKTTLLTDWAADRRESSGEPIAWLTVDDADNVPGTFARSVVASFAQGGSSLLTAAMTTVSYTNFASSVVGALESVDERVTLILDDAHLLHDRGVLDLLGGFLRRAPRNVRVVIAGRYEPPLALQRLRLDGLVGDISTSAIAFTPGEASEVLERSGIVLGPDDLTTLMRRTEGWAAGLRLAVMTLTESSQPSEVIEAFSGSQHTVADYLVGEVLGHVTPSIRTFLVETSIPDWFTAELAEHLTGDPHAQNIIADLLAHNFFLDRIAGTEPTYRYHPLMREYLRAEVARLGAAEIRNLERAASSWFVRYREPMHALRHAVHAGDRSAIFGILDESGLGSILRGHAADVLTSIDHSPAAVRHHPGVRLLCATAHLAEGNAAPAVSILAALSRPGAANPDTELFRRVVELHAAINTGTFATKLDQVRSLDIGRSGSPELDAYALSVVAAAELYAGRTSAAQNSFEDAAGNARAAALHPTALGCLVARAECHLLTGRFEAALASAAESRRYASEHQMTAAPMYAVAQSIELLVLTLRAAPASTPKDLWDIISGSSDPSVVDYGRRAGWALRLPTTRARNRPGWLDFERPTAPALEALLAPMVQRHYLSIGEVHHATELVDATARRLGHVGEVALLAAEMHRRHGRLDAADAALKPIVDGTTRCAHPVNEVRGLLAAACVAATREHPARAFDLVTRALASAEPESVLLPFVEAGVPVREILTQNHGRFGLLETFAGAARAVIPHDGVIAHRGATGTLTRRELELLRELPSWRTAEQIAADNFVSVNTVKTHLRGIYRKLEVRSRRDAIAAAHELGLL